MVHPPLTPQDVLLAGEPATAELSSWLDAIAELTRAANRGGPLEELLDLIAGATARLTGYDFCAVFVADQERQCLVIRGSYGLSQEYVDTLNAEKPIPIRAGSAGEGPSSRAFRAQRPTTVLDIHADTPSRQWEAVAAQQGYSSLVSVPVVASGEPFGLLNCYTVDKHPFGAREIILLESMANQAGLAIETTRRLAELRGSADRSAAEAAALRADLEAHRQADEHHRALLRALEDGGLPAVAASLARTLRCTVVIDDADGRLLAAVGPSGRPGSADGRVTAAYQQARESVTDGPDPDVAGTAPDPGSRAGADSLVVPVVLDEEVAGRLWALQPRASFGPAARQTLTRAAAVVALALVKERTAQEVEWRLSRDFLDDLFDADTPNGEALRARARQLGTDLSRPHTVLVVRRDAADSGTVHEEREAYAQRSLLSLVQRTGAAWGGATLTATRSDHVVVLWHDGGSTRGAQEFAEHLRREIQAYAGGWTATIAIGPTCSDIREYGDAYRLGCGVLDLVQRSGRSDRVVSLDSIGAYRLLLQVKQPQELQRFAESTLGTVHAYDRQHQTQLGSTLRSYMAHRCNVAVTAKGLHVHPNTVAYRLRRVEELLEIDLGDPQAMLHLQLAFMIEGVLGD
ncbi:helix-turn-helix domain-containing protein [Geodermatophilus sp. SYSU D00815]